MNKLVSFSHGNIALTFDDVVLVPAYSDVVPAKAEISTMLTRKIKLGVPIVSAAMDTVTESRTAIALALQGGFGIVHRNNTAEEQAIEVKTVKSYSNWIIHHPAVVNPDNTIDEVKKLSAELGVAGFPVVENGKLVGMIAGRDLRFAPSGNALVRDLMTKNVIHAKEGTSLTEAKKLMHEKRVEKLPLMDSKGHLAGLITHKDVMRVESMRNACVDANGNLMVGAAVGVDDPKRVDALIAAGVDCLVIDTAHGHSKAVIDGVKKIKSRHPDAQVIAGNVSSREGAQALISAGADAVKVGQGPGSICTTRIVSGAGMTQLTAIIECALAGDEHKVPVIADGGIRYSGDIAKAIAAGASSVMLGSLFAGTDEAPGRLVIVGGRKFKQYRGMGSVGAMMKSDGGKSRYHQENVDEKNKLVPEGIEGLVPWKGPLPEMVYQLVGGLKSGMGYCGAATIEDMRKKARFARITSAGSAESHPHDITITDEAPNYPMGRG